MNLDSYIFEKIKILEDFDVKLSSEQIAHIKSLKSEYQVDAYARSLLKISTII